MNHASATWHRNLFLLWAGQFLTTAGLTIVVPLLPFYLESLGATRLAAVRWWSGLALAAPALTLMLASPLWGRLGDRLGRKWMVTRALFGIGISVILMGLAATPLQFLLCRLLQGMCGGVTDAATAFVGAQAPDDMRGRALGRLQGANAAGALAGPLIGGIVADLWGMRPIMFATGATTVVCSLLATFILQEDRTKHDRITPPPSLTRTAVHLLRHRQLRAFVVAGICAQAGVYGLVTVFAPHVRAILADPSHAASWVGTLQAVTWGATFVGAAWWGRRNDRKSLENNFMAATSGCAVSIILQALPSWPGWLFPLRLLQGFFFSAVVPTVYLRVSREATAVSQGTHIGVTNSFLTLGQILGSLMGAMLAGLLAPAGMFFLIGCLFVCSAGLVRQAASPRIRQFNRGITA